MVSRRTRVGFSGSDSIPGRSVALRWCGALGLPLALGVALGGCRSPDETVLLGVTRGSGARSLRGMRRSFREDGGVLFLRPLLDLTRDRTEAACRADGLTWWNDPHNADPRFTRARVRHTVMPVLERELGPGVAQALARTADLVREESEVVDVEVDRALRRWYDGTAIDLVALGSEPAAVRTRVLRHAAIDSGAVASELTRAHVLAMVDLRPGKEVQLPGHVTAT